MTAIHTDGETPQPSGLESNEEQAIWKPGKAQWLVIATMSITSLLVALDSTILVPVLPTLAIDLHGTAQEAFWAGTSYLLSAAVFQPSIAAFSDIFGRRQLLLLSIILFLIGSIVAASARSFTSLLAGRVVQGTGGGGIITLAQVVFADIIPLRQRPKYFSLVLVSWATGSVLGPLIGGILVQKSTWRWCFYLNCPICAVALLMAWRYVNITDHQTSLNHKLRQIDWVGNFVFIGGLTSFLIAISWGGTQYPWSSWHTILPLTIGAALIICTIAHAKLLATNPFLTRSLFSTWSAICSYICAMFHGIALYIALYYLPFYQISVHSKSPFESGILLLPALCCLLPGSAVVSILITRIGIYRPFIWLGWTVGTIGAGLFLLFDQKTGTAVWAVALAVFGVGMGMVLSSVNFSTQAVVEPKDAGKAASMYAFMRSVGMCIGVAIGGGVFQNFMKAKCIELGLPADYAVHAETLIYKIASMTDSERILVVQAYVHGFQGVWAVLTAISGAGLLVGLGIKHFCMDRMLESKLRLVH